MSDGGYESENNSDPGIWESNSERRVGFLSILNDRETELVELILSSVPPEIGDSFIDWLERLPYDRALELSEQMDPNEWLAYIDRLPESQQQPLREVIEANRDVLELFSELLRLRAEGVRQELAGMLQQRLRELEEEEEQ